MGGKGRMKKSWSLSSQVDSDVNETFPINFYVIPSPKSTIFHFFHISSSLTFSSSHLTSALICPSAADLDPFAPFFSFSFSLWYVLEIVVHSNVILISTLFIWFLTIPSSFCCPITRRCAQVERYGSVRRRGLRAITLLYFTLPSLLCSLI